MSETIAPREPKDVEAAVQWAVTGGRSLEIVGRGTKRMLGRPVQADAVLDLSALIGVTLYEPDELVLSVQAGTARSDVEALLEASGQELAFEPIDYGALLGWPESRGTIGGMVAAGLSGPRRIKAGALRDHFLGFKAVSGRGEAFKSGGRVVKNVTGYDLSKLIAGSWGTLAVLTEITLKTLPRAETQATLAYSGLDDASANELLCLAMGSSADVSGAAHLPAPLAERAANVSPVKAVTALRIEGFERSVKDRIDTLAAWLKGYGAADLFDAAQSRRFWRAIRDVEPFAANGPARERFVWRISTEPARGAELGWRIGKQADAEILYDWAGGLVWAAIAPEEDGGAARIREAVDACGGHATLIRAPAPVRDTAGAFQPIDPTQELLTRRVKESFDPNRVLNPGRMWRGL